MEKQSNSLNISSYGVSNTSLEEVFLELGEEDYETNPIDIPINNSINSFQYLNSLAQVGLLIKKRFTIQKRDLKGLFFKIVLPVILICSVLMVLLIDVPIEGSALVLTPELYNTSGTGASIGNKVIVAGSKSNKKNSFVDTFYDVYPSVDMSVIPNLNSSQDVSAYILDGLQNGRREFNFGSIVLGDTMDATLNVNWTEFNTNSEGNTVYEQIKETLLGNVTSLISDVNITSLIEDLNSTLIAQNVTGSEEFIASLVEVISDGGSVLDLLNETLTFINVTSDAIGNLSEFLNSPIDFSDALNQTLIFFNLTVDDLQEIIFGSTDTITIEGDGWSVVLTEDQLLNLLNNNITFESYSLKVDVPVSVMHNTSSSHR